MKAGWQFKTVGHVLRWTVRLRRGGEENRPDPDEPGKEGTHPTKTGHTRVKPDHARTGKPRNAAGPRSLRPRRHTGVRVDPMATEQPQPLRAGTSRAPERDRSLTLSLSSPEARNQSLDTRFAE